MISYDTYIEFVKMTIDARNVGVTPDPSWLAYIEIALEQHPEWASPPTTPPPPSPPPPPAPPALSTTLRAAIVSNEGYRMRVDVDEHMERIADKVLNWWSSRFCIFQTGGRLVEVQIDRGKGLKFLVRDPDSPRMVPIGATRARALASRMCRFFRMKKKKKKEKNLSEEDLDGGTEQLPPEWLGPTIVTRADFGDIPVFSALAQAPTLRSDGALIHEPGYDESTGLYLVTDLKVRVPSAPSKEDAHRAGERLLDLLCDFEFTKPAGKSVWLAALLSIVCRHVYRGPTPIFVLDASKPGAGKSASTDMISHIALGRSAPRMSYSNNDVEMDKRITSLGIAGEQLVLIDNITTKLASACLDAALTGETYRGRVLGKIEMTPAIPMKIVWLVTGNGVVLGANVARRALIARIEPSVDHPEYRTGPRPGETWKHDIQRVCLDRRSEFLSDALTIVAAYIQAGRPKISTNNSTIDSIGSFEGWSNTIRSAIIWAGFPDPCETSKDTQAADMDDLALRNIFVCWPVPDEQEVTASALVELAQISFGEPLENTKKRWRNALLEWLPAKAGKDLPTPRELGIALRSIRGAINGIYKIEAGKHGEHGVPWRRIRI